MSAVRPEYGPTLPAVARARFGVRPWVTLGAVALLALAILAGVLSTGGEKAEGSLLLRRADPSFSLLYDPELVRPVRARAGEFARLEARGRAVALSVVVRPLPPPREPGPLTLLDLPIRSVTYVDELRARLPDFRLGDEGRARLNDAPGYQLRFRAGPRARRIQGHEILLLPTEESRGGGALISLRQSNRRARLRAGDKEVVTAANRAMRSFRFGTERP